ncbi:MAG: hypothetical protein AB8B65_20810 [Kordia sp.]|uniref:hypothetical protein n=1 Tax=Kordia sp. TaxID=1965332 RepID=UPI00385D85C1
MKNSIYLILTFIFCYNVNAQKKSSAIEKRIIMHLYLDDMFKLKDSKGKVINDFSLLNDVSLNYNYMEYESSQIINFDFYQIQVNENNLTSKNDATKISIIKSSSQCGSLVLGFYLNNIYNHSYRLQGFSTNDLPYLVYDIAKEKTSGTKIKKIVQEIDSIFESLDIECMHKSIKKLDFDSECMKSNCYRKIPFSYRAH